MIRRNTFVVAWLAVLGSVTVFGKPTGSAASLPKPSTTASPRASAGLPQRAALPAPSGSVAPAGPGTEERSREIAPPVRDELISPCAVERLRPERMEECETLFRLGTWAVLAANAQSGPGTRLAADICELYTRSLESADRHLQADAGRASTSGSGGISRNAIPARLPEPLRAYETFCKVLAADGGPDDLPTSAAAAVLVTRTGRVTVSDALRRSRSVKFPKPEATVTVSPAPAPRPATGR